MLYILSSDSSSNSHLGSEADDEGEETSWESGPVKKVIPWWENKDDADMDDDTSEELSLSLQPATSTSNFHARLHQNSTPMDVSGTEWRAGAGISSSYH